jgi:hypothetical protein
MCDGVLTALSARIKTTLAPILFIDVSFVAVLRRIANQWNTKGTRIDEISTDDCDVDGVGWCRA